MMKFFRRFQNLGLKGAQAKIYDKNTRELRIGEMKKEFATFISQSEFKNLI